MQPRFRSFRMLAALWGVVFAPLAPTFAADGSFADRVPADTIGVVSWRHLTPPDSVDRQLMDEFFKSAGPTIQIPDGPAIPTDLVRTLFRGLNNPGAFALLDLRAENQQPDVQAVLMIRAGADATPLANTLHDFVVQAGAVPELVSIGAARLRAVAPPNATFKLYWGAHDGYFLGSLSRPALERVLPLLRGEADPTLATNPRYRACVQAAGGNRPDLGELYVNLPALKERLVKLATAMGDPPPPEFEQTLEHLGLNALQALYLSGAETPHGETTTLYLHAPGELTGVLKLYDQEPLSRSDLALIPADAYIGAVWNLDLAALLNQTLDTIEKFDPDVRQQIESGLAGAGGFVGLSITNDILPAFGNTWAFYDARSHGALPGAGMVVVAEMNDPELFPALMDRIAQIATSFGMQERPPVRVTRKEVQRNGRTVHYVAISGAPVPVAPAWTFVNNRLILGLWPQSVLAAAKHVDVDTRSRALINDPAAKQVIEAVLPEQMISFSYVDSKLLIRAVYPFLLGLNTAGTNALATTGVDLDGFLYPTLEEVVAQSPLSFNGVARTEDGVLANAVGTAANPALVAAVVGIGAGVAMPAVINARAKAQRVVSAVQLRNIGMCCAVYANDNRDELPPDFETLIDTGCLTRDQLTSPRDPSGGVSYVYIPGLSFERMSEPGRAVLAYEKPFSAEGTNVLFLDGHVEWMLPHELDEVLRYTFDDLGRSDELPNIEWP